MVTKILTTNESNRGSFCFSTFVVSLMLCSKKKLFFHNNAEKDVFGISYVYSPGFCK